MATPLELFFARAWQRFLDSPGGDWDGTALQDAIEETGLAAWREATAGDVSDYSEYEVGDPILVLTEAGRLVLAAARGIKP